VSRNAEPAADFLRPHVLGYETQALTLARRKPRDGVLQGVVRLGHG